MKNKLITIFLIVLFLFGLLFVNCINPHANELASQLMNDCEAVIHKNANLNDQEKRLYMALIHFSNEFTDAEVIAIDKIYKETNNYFDERILKIYFEHGLHFEKAVDIYPNQTQTNGDKK